MYSDVISFLVFLVFLEGWGGGTLEIKPNLNKFKQNRIRFFFIANSILSKQLLNKLLNVGMESKL